MYSFPESNIFTVGIEVGLTLFGIEVNTSKHLTSNIILVIHTLYSNIRQTALRNTVIKHTKATTNSQPLYCVPVFHPMWPCCERGRITSLTITRFCVYLSTAHYHRYTASGWVGGLSMEGPAFTHKRVVANLFL